MTKIEIIQTIIQAIGLLSLVVLGLSYYFDKRWKRAEAANQFYNSFDSNKECQLAMFMLDYQKGGCTFEFDYDFPKLSKVVHVTYNKAKRSFALRKPYAQLDEEEQVIRFIFDVYIGYLERVFYLIKQGYFSKQELIFYKYWLDKLVLRNCSDVRSYAAMNSFGLFVPFLRYYQNKLQSKMDNTVTY
jgi:hypothetical protein